MIKLYVNLEALNQCNMLIVRIILSALDTFKSGFLGRCYTSRAALSLTLRDEGLIITHNNC
jgi:hypothetical protein